MATFEITIDDEKIQHLLQSDRGMAALLEPILNQMLQAEMTEHLGAESDQRTDTRQGYRNGSYATGRMSGSSPHGSERSTWRSLETGTARFKPSSSSGINGRRRPW
jgi:hypothetical protein